MHLLEGIDENGEIRPEAEEAVMEELKGNFRPEFLNRLDEIIMFKPLTKDNIGNIIKLLMEDLNKRLADRELKVELTKAAEDYITEKGYDPVYGARPLKRFLQKYVETLAVSSPSVRSIRMVSPSLTFSARINFAANVSTYFCRKRFSGLAPYTGS